MKKFVKWFCFWTLVLGGMALAICYLVIPERTKSAMDIVIGYLNTPLGIAGGSTITLGIVLYIIFRAIINYKTLRIKELLNEQDNKYEKLENAMKEEYELASSKMDKLNGLCETLDTKINETKDFAIKICETLPNAKVKKLGETYKEKNNGGEETVND